MHLLIFFLFAISICTDLAGQDNYPAGGRAAALGQASVTLRGLWSAHYNQAGTVYADHPLAGISYENRFLIQGLGIRACNAIFPVGRGAFALDMNFFGYEKYAESKYGLSYARKLGENFSAGVQMDYLFTRIADQYGSKGVFAVEAGMQANITDQLHTGVHIFNPTRSRLASFLIDSLNDYTEYAPTIMNLGFDYAFSKQLMIVFELEKEINHKASVKGGLEYHISEPLFLRLGVSSQPFSNSFGFGLMLRHIYIDVAMSYHLVLGYSPVISLHYAFQ